MEKYRVVEKFVSINGEGTKAGQLTAFIRFKGCNLNCSYCDTEWANIETAEYEEMSPEQLKDWVLSTGVVNVTVTGGEPLLQRNINELFKMLSVNGVEVEVETNGSIDIKSAVELGDLSPSLTVDYKLPSSGMERDMNTDNYRFLRRKDTVKFVIGSEEDLIKTHEIIREFSLSEKCSVYLSAVFGEIEPKRIVEYMIENKMNHVNFQLQMHKFIWDPDMKGV